MKRDEVVAVIESLANGLDPTTSEPVSHSTLQAGSVVRALFAAVSLLKEEPPRAKTKFAATGTLWTRDEEEQVCREFEKGMSVAQIGLRHGRSSGAIKTRLVKLGKMDDPPKMKVAS
ncbi:MAG: hypothetical protein ACTHQM_14210 [Thermoanaerobaculia bacterium]